MTGEPTSRVRDDRFATLLDEDGRPPCDPADACPSCRLFDGQRPGESRMDWLARIAGLLLGRVDAAAAVDESCERACRCLACADRRRAEDVPPLPIQIGSISIPSLKPGRRGPRAPAGGARGATRTDR